MVSEQEPHYTPGNKDTEMQTMRFHFFRDIRSKVSAPTVASQVLLKSYLLDVLESTANLPLVSGRSELQLSTTGNLCHNQACDV